MSTNIEKTDVSPHSDKEALDILIEEKEQGGELIVHVTPDRVRAYLTLQVLESQSTFTPADVYSKLRAIQIEPSTDARRVIEEAFSNFPAVPISISRLLIAEGKEPTAGKDGQVIWYVDLPAKGTEKLVEDEEGRVDYRELGLVKNLLVGEKILEITEPEIGEPGVNIFGVEIPGIPGKPAPVRPGQNVTVSEDGRTFFAAVDGHLVFVDGVVIIDPVYEVKEDVNFSTGNIDSKGRVVVRGNVLDGFVVKAEKGVEVHGVIGSATIESGGDIIIAGGMSGKGKGTLVAKGNIQAKYLDQVEVKCRGDLVVANEIVNCNAQVGGHVVVKSGRIVGGKIEAMGRIHAAVLGSATGTRTILSAGRNVEVEERLRQVNAELAKHNSIQKAITSHIGPLLQDREKLKQLPPHRLDQVKEMVATLKRTKEIVAELERQKEELEAIAIPTGEQKIIVERKVMPGVELIIANCRRNVVGEMHGPMKLVPNEEDGSIRAVGYR